MCGSDAEDPTYPSQPSPPFAAHRDAVPPTTAHQAIPQVLASAIGTIQLLTSRRLHHPRRNVGRTIHFADGSSAWVYRETRVDTGSAKTPTVLVVGFVLRGIRGPAHLAFRLESWLNLPMFVGFPGFTSKLWMTNDQHGCYRGVYEWDGAERALAYVRALSWVLGLVSVPGTIRAHLVPGVHRDDALSRPELLGAPGAKPDQWWQPASHHEGGSGREVDRHRQNVLDHRRQGAGPKRWVLPEPTDNPGQHQGNDRRD